MLTALIFLPLIGALFILMQSEERAIWNSAFIFSLLPLALSFYVCVEFNPQIGDYQFVEQYDWIPAFGITYHIGIDGISLFLVLLTTILITLSLLYSGGGDIEERPREFCFFMLVLETGLLGTLLSVDLFLFYMFWEVMLIPMYFLIGIWGHGRKIYAAIKFVLFTMVGSLLMLVAILYLVYQAHVHFNRTSFDLPLLYQVPLTVTEGRWLFAAFALAFAIKVPMWPVHTWLPDAHTNAPTAGSVILAGVMLKMGTYGFLRFAIPLFPTVAVEAIPLFMALAVIGIIYGALVAMMQPDLKRLIAYSSVSHLGFVMLGIFALNPEGIDGAIYQMLNHGVSTGGLFLLVGMLYMRRHTREISEFGGLWKRVPVYAAIFMVVMLSSIGLPGLNGFVGEFLIMLGAFLRIRLAAVFAVVGVILERALHALDLRARDVRADHQGGERNDPRSDRSRDCRDGAGDRVDAVHGTFPASADQPDRTVGDCDAREGKCRAGSSRRSSDRPNRIATLSPALHGSNREPEMAAAAR